ncbi:site-specific integrase [Vibrio campbellii]
MLSSINSLNQHASQLGVLASNQLNSSPEEFCCLPLPRSAKSKPRLTSLQILEKYSNARRRFKRSTEKCISQDHQTLKNALQLFPFVELEEIDRENAEWLRNVLYLFPKNFRKYQCFNGLVGIDVVIANSTHKFDTLSKSTVKGIIQKLSTFCNWAVNHGYIDSNEFRCLATLPQKHEDKRQALTNENLADIFHMADYIQHKYKHPYYFWLPIMLRYTGARMNELCQLYRADVITSSKIPYFQVHEKRSDQRVKNHASKRKIPIHSELIRLGFLEFIASLNSERVFPELKLVDGYYSHNASKWFARRRAALGLGKGYDAHSFRHTFVNELKQNLIPREVIKSLIGHDQQSDSFNVYGKEYQVDVLKEFIEKIDTTSTAHLRPYL